MSTFVRPFAAAILTLAAAAGADTQTQWDFSGDLSAAFGTGTLDYLSDETKAGTEFGSPGEFGLPEIDGGKSQVMHFPKAVDPTWGYIVIPDAPPNNGVYVNAYTLIFDILVPQSAFDAGDWLPFHNTNAENANDAELYMDPTGAIGIDGNYAGRLFPDTWHRVGITYEVSQDQTTCFLHKYIDGQEVGSPYDLGGLDGRHSIYSNLDATPWMYFFTEPGGFAASAYVNSVYFTDRTLSAEEIAGLGCPGAEGATTPGGCAAGCYPDFTGEGDLDLFDFLAYVNAFNNGEPAADCDHDAEHTFFDFLCFTNAFNAGC